jgi:hypothetical protein
MMFYFWDWLYAMQRDGRILNKRDWYSGDDKDIGPDVGDNDKYDASWLDGNSSDAWKTTEQKSATAVAK